MCGALGFSDRLHPFELRTEIALGLSHQLAGKRLQVGELLRVVGRDDEAEMVTVTLTAFGKCAGVGGVAEGVD
jgi:hypothetical protein